MNYLIEQQLIQAIETRKMVSFIYIEKDARRDIRMAAPHALFISTAGHKNIDAFQYDGYSKQGNLPDWRQFTIDNIRDIDILDESFEIAHGYNQNSSKYQRVICKV